MFTQLWSRFVWSFFGKAAAVAASFFWIGSFWKPFGFFCYFFVFISFFHFSNRRWIIMTWCSFLLRIDWHFCIRNFWSMSFEIKLIFSGENKAVFKWSTNDLHNYYTSSLLYEMRRQRALLMLQVILWYFFAFQIPLFTNWVKITCVAYIFVLWCRSFYVQHWIQKKNQFLMSQIIIIN